MTLHHAFFFRNPRFLSSSQRLSVSKQFFLRHTFFFFLVSERKVGIGGGFWQRPCSKGSMGRPRRIIQTELPYHLICRTNNHAIGVIPSTACHPDLLCRPERNPGKVSPPGPPCRPHDQPLPHRCNRHRGKPAPRHVPPTAGSGTTNTPSGPDTDLNHV